MTKTSTTAKKSEKRTERSASIPSQVSELPEGPQSILCKLLSFRLRRRWPVAWRWLALFRTERRVRSRSRRCSRCNRSRTTEGASRPPLGDGSSWRRVTSCGRRRSIRCERTERRRAVGLPSHRSRSISTERLEEGSASLRSRAAAAPRESSRTGCLQRRTES